MNVWFTARGAGLSALVLLTISTGLGALVSRHGRASTRYVIQYVHRAAAGLGLAVLALHVGTILADSYAKVGWRGALIPFTAGYRPTWVALGSLAAYTFVGVAVLGLARGRMAGSPLGARVWRSLHGLAYVGWASAMLHGFNSGTDRSVGWVRLLYLACLVAVLSSVVVRVAQVRRASGDRFAHVAPNPHPAQLTSQGASR
ncbi:MAG: methionine sulfoxide reductase heme-binding subunit [Pseudonocardiales bacterium]|jgi:predicted ferric reductase|nr:methionine sulfoxide reductase heme-binding subunit [Pseudonocardiales bacterium]MDT4948443.1 methionine sulfoxide reductase heme-binding subunit [Pseudonocardiales bacterium]